MKGVIQKNKNDIIKLSLGIWRICLWGINI